jgi:hypothetical protein
MAALVDGEEELGEVSELPLSPETVVYCPFCTMPPEYCEYGPCYNQCLPWLRENFPEFVTEDAMARGVAAITVVDGEPAVATAAAVCFAFILMCCKSKSFRIQADSKEDGAETAPKKKSGGSKKGSVPEIKVIIAKIQRQKRKYVTAIAGLESVPGAFHKIIFHLINENVNLRVAFERCH